MQAIPPVVRTTLISCRYDATGLAYVEMYDNNVLAWLVDETGTALIKPVIVGSMPPPTVSTAPVISPQWAVRETWEFIVPDYVRGAPGELFTFLATNNGAQRGLYANFTDMGLINDFNAWGRAHPTLWLKERPY